VIKIKLSVSSSVQASVVVAVVTSLWVYLISDNPVKIALSLIIGLCCGVVSFFVLTDKNFILSLNKNYFSNKKILVILFILFLVTSIASPIDNIFVVNWFSLPLLNWLSFALSLLFGLFVSGFIILNLLGVYQKIPFSASVILSVLVSMYFTTVFWFFVRMFPLSNNLSYVLFVLVQFILVLLYSLKIKGDIIDRVSQKRVLSLNVVFPLLAIVNFFVSLIVLQEFVYAPFVRGDSWDYVGTSIAITKGAFGVIPAGKFYILSTPNLFETFLSAVTGLSGFPPVNSVLVLSLVMAVLLPVAFYVMCLKYTKNTKIGILSTFLFVVSSGFGWVPFVGEKLLSGVSYSVESLPRVVEGFAPKVLFDITQPQGVLSEGLKTYAFGLLAVIMLLYLFESKLPSKARVALIAIIVAFAFQVHVEEALIFTLAVIPAFLLLSRAAKVFLRENLVGVSCGLAIAFLFDIFSNHTIATGRVSSFAIVSVFSLGLLFVFTFLKIDTLVISIKGIMQRYKLLIFLSICYLTIFCLYVLFSYGYPLMTPDYSMAVVFAGLTFPWYYYPMSLGVVGLLVLIGLMMNFQNERKISCFLLIVVFLIIFGSLISFFNVNIFLTGAKEWRIIYRMIPIPASVFAGWVLYNLLKLTKGNTESIMFFSEKKPRTFHLNKRFFSIIIMLLVIILGIPSTIIASEYWMTTALSPNGNFNPDAADVELANYFYHVPLTSRAAVFSSSSNALVRLAGVTTAMPGAYLNLSALTRPETIALISSDVRYVVVDKTSNSDQDFALLNFLSVAFNNSKYVVYSLPYLQSSISESTVGYVAPLHYGNDSLLSFMLISSLNFSYQVVNNDIYNKSILIVPTDFPQTQQDGSSYDNVSNVNRTSYPEDAQLILSWVNEGGNLVVFGGEGAIYKYLGLTTEFPERQLNINSVRIDSRIYSFNETINAKSLSYNAEKVKTLSYYQFNGNNVCPFAIQEQVGGGSIIYFNVDPLYAANESQGSLLFNSDFLSIISQSLINSGTKIVAPINSEIVPTDERWLAQYTRYAENDFTASGNITIDSTLSGSYLLPESIVADKVVLQQGETQNLSSLTIYNITVKGKADLEINSNELVSVSDKDSIPNYFQFQLSNCSVTIKPIDGGSLQINTEKGNFITKESLTFTFKMSSLVVEKPSIDVNGSTSFDKISIPTSASLWSDNVNLEGATKFHIAYGDSNYIFFDEFSYPPLQPRRTQDFALPLVDILLSPMNIGFLITFGMLYLVVAKKQLLKRN
jgi:hypothetical protein